MALALDPWQTQPRTRGRFATRLSPEEERDIRDRYAAGATMRELATLYVVGVGTIHRVVQRVPVRR